MTATEITREAAPTSEPDSKAPTRAARLYEQLAAAQNALRGLGLAYADLKAGNDDLAAENARLRGHLAILADSAGEAETWAGMRPAEAGQALAALVDAVKGTAAVDQPDVRRKRNGRAMF
ncbi:hypothetical protein [Micromonospora profundi]|uniref:hypothetical protein n=1 Tax=Micromonospora profundi TaxID=1420889 RepID=UPI0036672351